MKDIRGRYLGVTYPNILCRNWILKRWKRWLCKREIHLLDEFQSPEAHSLCCDACGLDIPIDDRKDQNEPELPMNWCETIEGTNKLAALDADLFADVIQRRIPTPEACEAMEKRQKES